MLFMAWNVRLKFLSLHELCLLRQEKCGTDYGGVISDNGGGSGKIIKTHTKCSQRIWSYNGWYYKCMQCMQKYTALGRERAKIYYLCLIRYIKMCWLLQSDAIIYGRHECKISKGKLFLFFLPLIVRVSFKIFFSFETNERMNEEGQLFVFFVRSQLPKMFVSSIINFIANEKQPIWVHSRKLTLKTAALAALPLLVSFNNFNWNLVCVFFYFRFFSLSFSFFVHFRMHLYCWTIYLT